MAHRQNQAQPLNLVQIPSLVQNPALDPIAMAHKVKKRRKRIKRRKRKSKEN